MTGAAIKQAMRLNPELNTTELAQMLANGWNNPEYHKIIHQINEIKRGKKA